MRESVQAVPATVVQSSKMISKTAIVALGLLATQIIAGGCSDRRESSFASMKEARASGAVARGWVPGDLPESAADLRELHDLDTNEVWGTFRFQTSELASSLTLTRVDASKINGHAVRSPRANWWPGMLTGNLDGRVLENSGVELYSTPAPFAFWIAIDRNGGRGFFWSTSR
jgi:hypothetical protein